MKTGKISHPNVGASRPSMRGGNDKPRAINHPNVGASIPENPPEPAQTIPMAATPRASRLALEWLSD